MSERQARIIESCFKGLGTDICLKIVIRNDEENKKAKEDIKKAKNIYNDQEKFFSRFDKKSELSKLNCNPGVFQKSSDDILCVARKSLLYYELSDKLFDPRIMEILECLGYRDDFKKNDFCEVLMDEINSKKQKNLGDDLKIDGEKIFFGCRMDFSGIAKGYITDKVSDYFKKQGWKNFVVNSGGDMFLAGLDEDGAEWTVEVEGITQDKFIFSASDKGVATSGITRRKWEINEKKIHHLINPKDPQNFSFDLKSVTAISNNCEKADVLAKTLFLMGKNVGLNFSEKNNIRSIFLDYRGNIFLSNNMKKNG